MIAIILGIIYASFLEWWVHKKLFHEYGRKKDSMFAFHLRDHHVVAKQNLFYDRRTSFMETGGLAFLSALHLPILYLSINFYIAIFSYAIAFFVLHNLSHRYPQFAENYQVWHWNHHMKDPNKNWNVVLPIADILLKTNK